MTRRPLVIDSFPIHDEMDLLECRLVETYDAIDYAVAVEADVTHQDAPKPYYLSENIDRFAPFKDKLIVVRATGLPTLADDPDPWARELAQRGFVADGLLQIPDLTADDIVVHGDVDEIPRAVCIRNVRPRPGWFVCFEQRLHCFAVDWLHPDGWGGQVAGRLGDIVRLGDHLNPFARLRDKRNRYLWPNWPEFRTDPKDVLYDSGWHLSWLGGQEAAFKKLGAYCHPEIADRVQEGLERDLFLREGWHVDGRKMTPVDVDGDLDYPKWIEEGNAPASWYRPR